MGIIKLFSLKDTQWLEKSSSVTSSLGDVLRIMDGL